MVDSFKNIERLRYRINKDLLAIYREIKKDNEVKKTLFVDECFSAIISSMAALFFSQMMYQPMEEYIKKLFKMIFGKDLPLLVLLFSALLAVFILIVVSGRVNKIVLYVNKNKKNKQPEGKDTTDYVKEFDNIACDSVFVSMEYKNMFCEAQNKYEKTLYYYEIIHYLDVASIIMEKLCTTTYGIKSPQNVLGVNLYRVHNMKNVMDEIHK